MKLLPTLLEYPRVGTDSGVAKGFQPAISNPKRMKGCSDCKKHAVYIKTIQIFENL